MKTGLLPLSQEAIILGDVAYYTLQRHSTLPSVATEDTSIGCEASSLIAADLVSERAALCRVISRDTHVLFVRCRGLLALGETIEEAWHNESTLLDLYTVRFIY